MWWGRECHSLLCWLIVIYFNLKALGSITLLTNNMDAESKIGVVRWIEESKGTMPVEFSSELIDSYCNFDGRIIWILGGPGVMSVLKLSKLINNGLVMLVNCVLNLNSVYNYKVLVTHGFNYFIW